MLPQPGQRRTAARRRPAGQLPDPRHRRGRPRPGSRVAYDVEAVGASMRAAGLPGRLADRLRARRCVHLDDRRSPPLQGRKPGDRRVRVERPHAPYFRYTGPGQLTAKEAASAPTTPVGQGIRVGPRLRSSATAGQRGGARRAAVEDQGAGDLQLGRDQLVGLRDRGDPARPDPRRRRRALGLRRPDQRRDRRSCSSSSPSQLSPDLHRLPDRRRLVHGVAAEHRADRLARSRRRRCSSTTCMTVAVSTSSAVEQIVSAFPALLDERVVIGVGAIGLITIGNLRGLREAGNIFAAPDLPVHRLGAADDRGRRRSGSSSSARARPTPPTLADQVAETPPSRSRSCCCCGRSPPAPSP